MKKRAIVTLAAGARFKAGFDKWYLPGWESYCNRHELDLIVIDKPLDDSPRAKSRSPSWQKCLVHSHPQVAAYEQVAWVDADIRIRPDSPNIFDGVSPSEIGAVDEFATPTREDYNFALERLYSAWDKQGVPYVSNRTPREYHARFGLEATHEGVVQCGVIVFSPALHGEIFQKTYDDYEDKGAASGTYEMRPLSYEIQNSGAIRWISCKFNMGWLLYAEIYYPFVTAGASRLGRLIRRAGVGRALRAKCVRAAFEVNYFLHFAGGSRDYTLLPPRLLV